MAPETATRPARPWQETVSLKRGEQKRRIAEYEELARQENITNSSVVSPVLASDEELIRALSTGHLSAKSVAHTFVAQAMDSHAKTNCLTEIMFCAAIKRAEALDNHLARHRKPVGPLHGVPITLKDQFNVPGYDSTLGYVGRAMQPQPEDCLLVKLLRSLGAIAIAKTNLPQSIMWCETENPLWGLTTNPFHPGYTPGGSTGGESALLSGNGSALGWGTDIGGSIRIPSHMMGLYGFKPSSARLPYLGVPVSTEGQEHVPSAVGPMARSLEMVQLATQSVIEKRPWDLDARCVPLGWRDDTYQAAQNRSLTIGVLMDDEVVRPHPPISRVLGSAVEKLRAAGHTIVNWDSRLHAECIEVMDQFYAADAGEDIRADIAAGGEPMIPHVERLVNHGNPPISVYEYWQLNRRKWALQQAYREKWRTASPSPDSSAPDLVDAVIMPAMPHTAVPHRGCRWVGYTKVWNLLDYPALVIPAGQVEAGDLGTSWDFAPRNEKDEWNQKLWLENRQDMADMGLPVGIQIVGCKLEEEMVLGVGKVVDDLLKSSNASGYTGNDYDVWNHPTRN